MTHETDLVSLKDFLNKFSNIVKQSQIRLWRLRKINDADKWMVKIGKHIYVNVPKFREWLSKK